MSFQDGLKTIVVATDLEGQSEAALEYATKLAHAYGARIVLAHGLDPMEYADVEGVPGAVLTGLNKQAREVLDGMAGDLTSVGIHSHSEIRQGSIAEMLRDVARQYQAGLIVIGTKGNAGVGPVVVGAIAEQLVRVAPCPVMAVAADWNAGQNRPVPGGPVLLALERNEACPAAVAAAYSLAVKFQRPLIVLHARTAFEASAFLNPGATKLADFGIKAGGNVTVRNVVKDGNPAYAIRGAIAQYQPCILVAGVKRSSDTPGPHGTIFGLLAGSRVPVLCVPPNVVPEGKEQEAQIPAGVR
jgi:nucleotide-binding universal stress UspA family protein